jgi:hypothetical protein
MIQQIRKALRTNPFFRGLMAYYIVPSGIFDSKVLKLEISASFKHRIKEVVACPDNAFIKRVDTAGQVHRGKQIMHNGLKINLGSYYGPEVAQQLAANRGVHEPQEEYVFQEVLKIMKPGSTMIELGAFWSFYSMWFQSAVSQARNFMVEPDKFNMTSGIKNFELNKMKGDFTQAFVGDKMDTSSQPRMICVDGLCKEKGITFIDMLHCDIQGYELDMLHGSIEMIKKDAIGYVFISTHSNAVHYDCMAFLEKVGFQVQVSCDLDETYAEDGLLVAKSPNYNSAEIPVVSKKSKVAAKEV